MFKKSLGDIVYKQEEITVVWIEIDTWVIKKMVLEKGTGGGMGQAEEEV
jgi:hypothetical protein